MFKTSSKKVRDLMIKSIKRLSFFTIGAVIIMGVIYGCIVSSQGMPAAEYTFFKQTNSNLLVIAHRGGGGRAPENTLLAFERVRDLGVDVIETDVRSTSDGALVVFHDSTVDRTTDGNGKISDKTLEELKKLDAGYRWSPDGGKTFPFRDQNIKVATLEEVFTAFPKMRFNIEPKQAMPSLIKPLCNLIRKHGMIDKVVIGSFTQSVLDEFRNECPEVATSAGPSEVGQFLTMYKTGLSESYSPAMQALQVPEYAGVRIVTKEFVEAAHKRNLKVHVWTVNEIADMQRLIGMGVDGIMTDYPDRLLSLIGRSPSP